MSGILSFQELVLGKGILGLVGWVAVGSVNIAALVTVIRYIIKPTACRHRSTFWDIAHVSSLVFLYCVGVNGLIFEFGAVNVHSPFSISASQILVSLAIGFLLIGIACVFVLATVRQPPQPSYWDCLGFGSVTVSLCLLIGGLLYLLWNDDTTTRFNQTCTIGVMSQHETNQQTMTNMATKTGEEKQ